ncbi:MAG: bifunctional folylpolyglutamate synthase/dihydrofolate synthase [Fibrobacteres bacterium]|nr:bifunctional folylpolyglutamate synthase/dihydrofolate synthase [Fibrobacterota bacterium]
MADLEQTLEYLYSLHTRGIKPGLERMAAFLERLGNPEKSFKSIHVAGTNGKGTVSTIAYNILRANGYSTGLYTSPHIQKFNERIKINESDIADSDIASFVEVHRKYIEDSELTFFEITTAMAFDAFRRSGVEYAVVEVGLGGRLDATNLLTPAVSVICDISKDHEDMLGSTISAIAGEKAGIIKKGVPVVFGVPDIDASAVIIRKASEQNAPAYDLFKIASWKIIDENVKGTEFDLSINDEPEVKCMLPMPGLHQVQNCALAIAAIIKAGIKTVSSDIYNGVSRSKLPGRLEYVEGSPSFVVDVAHNPKKISALAAYLKKFFPKRKKVALFGVMKDKDYKEMVSILKDAVDEFVFTSPDLPRALDAAELTTLSPGEVVKSVPEAVKRANNLAGKDGVVIITGSFYTVAEAIERLM